MQSEKRFWREECRCRGHISAKNATRQNLPELTIAEYAKSKWNIVKLSYENHKLAHLLLFKSFNIRTYQRTLRYMSNDIKNHEMLSMAAKRGWKTLHENEEKFKEWKRKRAEYLHEISSEKRTEIQNNAIKMGNAL